MSLKRRKERGNGTKSILGRKIVDIFAEERQKLVSDINSLEARLSRQSHIIEELKSAKDDAEAQKQRAIERARHDREESERIRAEVAEKSTMVESMRGKLEERVHEVERDRQRLLNELKASEMKRKVLVRRLQKREEVVKEEGVSVLDRTSDPGDKGSLVGKVSKTEPSHILGGVRPRTTGVDRAVLSAHSWETEARRLRERCVASETESLALRSRVVQLEEEVAKVNSEKGLKEDECNGLREQIEELRRSGQEELDLRVREAETALQTWIVRWRDEAFRQRKRAEEAVATRDRLEREADDHAVALATLAARLDETKRKLTSSEAEAVNARTALADLEAKLASSSTPPQKTPSQKTSSKQPYTSTTAQAVSHLHAENARLLDRNIKLDRSLEATRRTLEARERELAKVDKRLGAADEALARAEEERVEFVAALEAVAEDRARLAQMLRERNLLVPVSQRATQAAQTAATKAKQSLTKKYPLPDHENIPTPDIPKTPYPKQKDPKTPPQRPPLRVTAEPPPPMPPASASILHTIPRH